MVAASLWKHGAIKIRIEHPFQLSSGNFTPLYVNCRVLIPCPAARDLIIAFAHYLYHSRRLDTDCIDGGETADMPFGAWPAHRLDKPFVYIRKRRKGHGTEGRVEGVATGEVLLFEDLITDGGSKLSFIEGIREAGCTISHCLVVVDREEGGAAVLAALGVTLHSLVTLSACLEAGRAGGFLPAADFTQVSECLAAPRAWHQRPGLPCEEAAAFSGQRHA